MINDPNLKLTMIVSLCSGFAGVLVGCVLNYFFNLRLQNKLLEKQSKAEKELLEKQRRGQVKLEEMRQSFESKQNIELRNSIRTAVPLKAVYPKSR